MRKIIFLDIDGVLNSQDWFMRRKKLPSTSTRDEFIHNQLDPVAVSLFKQLVEDTGASVVLSSTWRRFEDDRRILNENGITWISTTPYFPGEPRGKEVEDWLLTQSIKSDFWVSNYAIIDDDGDFLEGQHLFQTNNKIGLTQGICDRIKRHLLS